MGGGGDKNPHLAQDRCINSSTSSDKAERAFHDTMDKAKRKFQDAIASSNDLTGTERIQGELKHLLEEADDNDLTGVERTRGKLKHLLEAADDMLAGKCRERRAAVCEEVCDEALFKTPPPCDDCPVCLLPLPIKSQGQIYLSCCGETICWGCDDEISTRSGGVNVYVCALCKTPPATTPEIIKRHEKLTENNDPHAMSRLGQCYLGGVNGLVRDVPRGAELLTRAAALGSASALGTLGDVYNPQDILGLNGIVESDIALTIRYYECAATKGQVEARYNLGVVEFNEHNVGRAMKHWMIAAAAGHDDALKWLVLYGFKEGRVTKEEYEKVLRAHKDSHDAMDSDLRSKAAASWREWNIR